MNPSKQSEFNPFDTILKCFLSATIFSVVPYIFYAYPNFHFNKGSWICLGALSFFSMMTFYFFFWNKFSDEVGSPALRAGRYSWPWYQLAYPLSEKNFWIEKRIPKYGIPLFISSKGLLLWGLISIVFWEKF